MKLPYSNSWFVSHSSETPVSCRTSVDRLRKRVPSVLRQVQPAMQWDVFCRVCVSVRSSHTSQWKVHNAGALPRKAHEIGVNGSLVPIRTCIGHASLRESNKIHNCNILLKRHDDYPQLYFLLVIGFQKKHDFRMETCANKRYLSFHERSCYI